MASVHNLTDVFKIIDNRFERVFALQVNSNQSCNDMYLSQI